MDFTGIFNAIISAFGADAVPDKKKVTLIIDKGKMTPQATQATQTPQQSKKVKDTAVFKTKTPPLPPTSSPPAPPKTSRTESERRRSEKEGRERQRTKSSIKKRNPKPRHPLDKLEKFFRNLQNKANAIKINEIEEYNIVKAYVEKKNKNRRMRKTEIEVDTNGLLENLRTIKVNLKLAMLSRQDRSSTKSPEMIAMGQFREHNKELFESLGEKGLDPFKQGNQQGGSSFKNLMPSSSPKSINAAQTHITPGSPRVRGG